MKNVTVAALQCELNKDLSTNVAAITELVKEAASQKAQIILPSELFEGPYFCKEEKDHFFSWARPVKDHPTLEHFQNLSQQLGVVIPVSFFEKDGPHYFNSVAIFDADGTNLGIYRKSHIPDGPGYEEKFYFKPGNTGFKTWPTKFGRIGVGICWDQWFPECARAMTLQGADLLFYPTAIGSEPEDPTLDTKDSWQLAMQGHAVSNVIPVIASNRVGDEDGQVFYGHSFIADQKGKKLAEIGRGESGVITSTFDLAEIQTQRASFGFFRDRRPELYEILTK